MKRLSRVDAAYIAGILDGEGCIGISRANTSKSAKSCRRGVSYRAYVTVGLTHRPLLVWLRATTGVGQLTNKPSLKPRNKPAWKWTVWSREAAELAAAVRSHLRIKGAQADNLMEFQRLMRQPGSKGLTDAEWDRRNTHHAVSRALNQRGVSP